MTVFRPAAEHDLEAEYRVFLAAEGELWRRHGFDWPAPAFEAWAPVHRHLLREDGTRAFVAADRGEVVAFAAALARGDAWYLSALFVRPDRQGCGIGGGLLDRVWPGTFARRMTVTDSFQPLSNGLYARRGLIPTTPILWLGGIPGADVPDALRPQPADGAALARIDRTAYGFDRTCDHGHWRETKGAPTLWARDGRPLGYAYTAASGLIGPLVATDEASAAEVLRAEMARRGARETMLCAPGTSRTMVATALASGLRFVRPPGLLLTSDGCPPLGAIAISGYWLL